MIKNKNRVTVLMSTFNGEKYLVEQIESLLSQESVTIDLLVRDDGSTDATCTILDNYKKQGKLNWYQGKNLKPAKSFMDLIKKASLKSDYYAFCDQDDVWDKRKLKRAIKCISQYEEVCPILYYSETKRVDIKLNEMNDVFKKHYHTEKFGGALIATWAPGCTMVWNSEQMKILKKYNPDYIVMHDSWNVCVCLAVGGKVIYDSKAYILYRQHTSNAVGGIEKEKLNKISLLKYRLRKFVDYSYKPSKVASELLKGYANVMPICNVDICKALIDLKNKPIKIFGEKQLRTGYKLIDLKFLIQILLKKA